MLDHNYFSNLIWQIADLLRGPYRPPQYEHVMLPITKKSAPHIQSGSRPKADRMPV